MAFSFTPSADSYPGSRQGRKTKVSDITLKASLQDRRGNDCAEQIEKVYGSDYTGSQTELQVGIKNTCKDPTVTLSLTDETGKVLDEKTFAIETQSKDKSSEKALIIFGIVILILLIFYVVAGVVNKKKKDEVNLSSFIFLFIFSTVFISAMFIPLFETEAMYTVVELPIDDFGGGGGGGDVGDVGDDDPPATTQVSFGVDLNKSSYSPNEIVTVTSHVEYNVCSNASAAIRIDGIVEGYFAQPIQLYNHVLVGGTSYDEHEYFSAPSVAGSYILKTEILIAPVSYSATDEEMSQILIENVSFGNFKNVIIDHISYTPELQISELLDALNEATTFAEVLMSLNTYIPNRIDIYETRGTFTPYATLDIPFNVLAPEGSTVNVTIKGESGEYVEGPVTKSVGNNVSIKWDSTNAYSCSCRCVNPSNESEEISCGSNPINTDDPPDCGTEFETGLSGKTIYNLVRDIKFKVTCSP